MFSVVLKSQFASTAVPVGANDPETSAGGPTALLAFVVAVLVVLAFRAAGHAIAPIAVVVRSLVAAGMAALMLLAAFALVVFITATGL